FRATSWPCPQHLAILLKTRRDDRRRSWCNKVEKWRSKVHPIGWIAEELLTLVRPSQQLHACKHGANRMLCEKGLPDFDELGVVHATLIAIRSLGRRTFWPSKPLTKSRYQ